MRNENHFSYSGEAIAREKKTNLQAFTMMSGETHKRFFVKFGGNLFFISTVFFFLNPIKSCRYVCFLVTLKTPHH